MSTSSPRLEVLYEDNHLLVVNKPVGVATMGAESGHTMHSLAAAYIKRKYHKPGNVFVGIVSRLDAMTSGVLVLARTSKAASRLAAQFGGQSSAAANKLYLAAVEGEISSPAGLWEDHLRKDDAAKRMRVVADTEVCGKLARTAFLNLDRHSTRSILAIRLLTGRKHQIRVQAADRGHPIIGDRKYSAGTRFPGGIALHSWRLQIVHPTRRTAMWFEADLPDSWRSLAARLPPPKRLRELVEAHFELDRADS